MRIFVALDIDQVIRKRIELFLDGVRGFAPDARWVRSESLHVTLKFIGNKPAEEVFVYLDRMRKIIEQSVFTVRGKDRRRKGSSGVGRGTKKQTHVTVSVGLAAASGDLTPTEVIRMADQALYKAKAKGRNCTITAKLSKAPTSVQQLKTAMSL